MPALDRSDLKLLTGVSTGVPVADMTWGETWSDDIIWTTDTNRTVSGKGSTSTDPLTLATLTTIPFTGGNAAIFYVNAFINFTPSITTSNISTNTVNLTTSNVFRINYIITAVDNVKNTITVMGTPTPNVGDIINQSFAFAENTTLQLRVREYVTSTGVLEDFKTRVLKLGQPVVKPGADMVNFDAFATVVDSARSWVRINLPTEAFTTVPVGADAPTGTTPVIYAGSLSLIQPADPAQPITKPASTDKLKYVWLIWSDEANIPGS